MRIFTLFTTILGISVSAYCQLSISGIIKHSSEWESKLYVIRIDRIGLHHPILVDSIFLNKDGSFDFTFDTNPQGILYELRQPPRGGNFQTVTSGYNDNWFHVISTEEKERIKISATADSLYYSLKIEGDEINKKLLIFRDFKRPIANIFRQMADSIQRFPLKSAYFKAKYFEIVISQLELVREKIINVLDTCKSTPIILAGLYYLNEASLGRINIEHQKKYSQKISSEEILLVKNIKKFDGNNEKNRIGLTLPDASFYDVAEKRTSLYSIKSKYKVLDFWASWCGPCRYANRNHLPQLNSFLSENAILLIAISIDKDKKKWEDAVMKDNTTWRQYMEPEYILSNFLDVGGIPLYIVIDENNVVVFEAVSTFEVESFLKTRI